MADVEKQFSIRRIFLKDASFENPLAPDVFRTRTEPKIEMAVRVSHQTLEDDRYDVTVTCTVTASIEGKTLFLCEVAQSGLFVVKGYTPAELDDLLNVACPVQLFPYIRAQITHLTVMGGFPPVMLAPVDFDQLYAASKRAAAGKA